MHNYEVAIVGGGPAGLAAALTLSRSLIRTVLFDAPTAARNAASPHIAALPGSDLISPAAFRSAVAAEIDRYGYTDVHADAVASISSDVDGGFCLTSDGGTSFQAARLLLATGMLDVFPAIERLDGYWGRSVINCPFCSGFEVKDRAWGVLADRPEVLAAAEVYRNWTDDLVLFVPPGVALTAQRAQEVEAHGIRVLRHTVVGIEGDAGQIRNLLLDDGSAVERNVLLIWPRQRQSPIVAALAPSLTDDGYVAVNDAFHTSLSNVYAAGDLTYGGHQNANTAIHMGNMAAASMVFDLCQTR